MYASKIYILLAIFLCYGLIISGFIILGASMDIKYLILDIIVSCIVVTQYVQYCFFPLINQKEKAQKDVGILGIKILIICVYSILVTIMIVCSICFDLSFIVQLFVQFALLFMLIIGYTMAHHASNKVKILYHKEHSIKDGKKQMCNAMEDLMNVACTSKDLDLSIFSRWEHLNESLRYISPSMRQEVCEIENCFIQLAGELSILVQNAQLNKTRIETETINLERLYNKRKQY